MRKVNIPQKWTLILLLLVAGTFTGQLLAAVPTQIPGLSEIEAMLSGSTEVGRRIIRNVGFFLAILGLGGMSFKIWKKTNDAIDSLTHWVFGIGVFLIGIYLADLLING